MWLSFGIVVLIFLAASLIILVSQRFVDSAIDEIANVEAPTRDASQEMDINLIEMSRNVSEYLRKSDLRYREQFTEDRAEFEESKTRYDELVDAPTGREQGERIGLLYGEYIALGESLMGQYEEQAGTSDDSVEAEDLHLPVIAMTANALEGDRSKAIAAGMDDYVAKPVQPAQLGEILERWTADAKGAELPSEGAGAIHEADAKGQTGPEDPFDPDVLAGLRELGNANLLAELVELFVDDAQSRIPARRDAFEKDDAEAVERIAHTLKGSCGNMGALRMAEICENLQEVGHSGDLSRASVLIE
jgi:HPt (histidine-containing phosphotransfer) domain-containing protein